VGRRTGVKIESNLLCCFFDLPAKCFTELANLRKRDLPASHCFHASPFSHRRGLFIAAMLNYLYIEAYYMECMHAENKKIDFKENGRNRYLGKTGIDVML
jgi:hypothetical protein